MEENKKFSTKTDQISNAKRKLRCKDFVCVCVLES